MLGLVGTGEKALESTALGEPKPYLQLAGIVLEHRHDVET